MSTTPGTLGQAEAAPSQQLATTPAASTSLNAPTSTANAPTISASESDNTAVMDAGDKTAAAQGSSAAPAPITTAGAPASDKQQGSSSVASEEKAPAAADASPVSAAQRSLPPSTNPGSKKRRKKGGLAGLFVALGCMTSDEFDDDPPINKTGGGAHGKGANATGAATSATSGAAAGTKAAAGVSGPSTSDGNPALNSSNNGTSAALLTTPTRPETLAFTPTEPTTPPIEETAGLTSGAVQAPGSGAEIIHQHQLHRSESEAHLAQQHGDHAHKTDSSGGYTDLTDTDGHDEHGQQEMLYMDEEYEDEEDRLIAQGGCGIPCDENGNPCPLLPPLSAIDTGRKCLVLDLDETLLHSSFKMLPSADYIVPVEIESQTHNVYVIKRPGVDHFLLEMGKIYEVVVFTASLSKYADPVLDMLDVHRVVRHRLFRESCYNHKGNYVKDLSQLGRDISTSIIIDNSPASYIFHPNNAVPVSTWFNDPHDTELTDLCPFLTDLATVDDVRGVLDGGI